MQVLGELVARPNLDEAEIENERDVIVEEIRSYLDDPAEHVNVLFDLAIFDDTPLGREIAGSEDSVRALPAPAIHEFWQTHYQPSNVVIAASGDLPHDQVVALAAGAFGTGGGPTPGYLPAPAIPAAAERPLLPAKMVRNKQSRLVLLATLPEERKPALAPTTSHALNPRRAATLQTVPDAPQRRQF